jgi:hypothetical protein
MRVISVLAFNFDVMFDTTVYTCQALSLHEFLSAFACLVSIHM